MKHLNTFIFFLIFSILGFFNHTFAQHLPGTHPASYESALMFAPINETVVAPADADFIAAAMNNTDKSGMYVIAQLKDVDLSPVNAGSWEELEDGTMIWRIRITIPGAKALSLHFDRFNLPDGGRFYVYDEERTQLLGGFSELDNTDDKGYSIGLIVGDVLIAEYVAPPLLTPGEKKAILNTEVIVPDIHISQVSHIFRGVAEFQHAKDIGDSESCEVNVNCPEGDDWQMQKRSVVRIYVVEGNSGGWCTGTLINNLANDGTPYILTANHCGPNATAANFNQWRFYFNLEYTTCTGTTVQSSSQYRTGCSKKAYGSINGGSDFFLLQLNQAPDNSWNPIYAGWRRDNTAATTATGIHHPAGDVKKISSSTTISTGSYTGCASNAHWRITDWRQTTTNRGVTEGGSSGSALFDQDGYLVGTLTGGAATCSNPHNDYYGKLYYHWDQNGSSSDQQAKPWLDPNNTGSTTCPMYDPNNPDNPIDPGTPDDPDDPDNPDNPDDPDDPGTPIIPGNCHRLHYPLGGTLTLYRTPDEGYLAGTNTYGDLAKADYFQKDSTTEYLVNLKMNVGVVSGTGNVTFCIWADNNGRPGSLIASKTVSLSTIASQCYTENDPQMPTTYPQLKRRYVCQFSPSVAISGNFFAGYMLPSSGQFALVTNTGNQAANTGWEMRHDSTWVEYSDSTSWGIALTHALFPQLCDNAETTDIEEFDNSSVIYPNPTTGIVSIRLADNELSNAIVKVYDMNGKLVNLVPTMSNDKLTLDLSSLRSGLYLISIQTPTQTITKKISLIK